MSAQVIEMLQTVIGGLGLFLFGMKLLSDGMEALAGNKLNRMVSAVTDNRLMAILAGVGVTCVIQSSSAVSVMVIGFVNSGVMTLMQAIGVIFGANIGTTLSLWVLTLDLSDYGPVIIGLASFVYLFAKKDKIRFTSMAIMGLGMLFFGMEMMSDGFNPLRENDSLRNILGRFDATTTYGFIMAVIASTIITSIVQSSTAIIVITMTLAANNVVNFPTSVAIIMGSNIGTCGTAVLACIGTARNAVRAALAHMLFNVFGVLIVIIVHTPFVEYSEKLVRWISNTPPDGDLKFALAIVWVHTVFNILNTVIMYPLMSLLEKLVIFLVPIRKAEAKSERYKPQYLDRHILNQSPIALAQAGKEILRMGDVCLEMLDDLHIILSNPERNTEQEESVFHGENNLDYAQKEIAEYVSEVLSDNVTHEIAKSARRLIRQADEFESVSDHIRNALKAFLKIRNAEERLTSEAEAEVLDLCSLVRKYCTDIMNIIKNGDKARILWATEQNKEINNIAKKYRNCHTQRLTISCKDPVKSLVYSDILIAFRRVNDHLLNVAETLRD